MACFREGGFFYYTRTLEGEQYSVYCRRKVHGGAVGPSGTLGFGIRVSPHMRQGHYKSSLISYKPADC